MTNVRKLYRACAVLAAALLSPWAGAEDIDLFLGLPASSVDAPNVLFIIDNTANWSQSTDSGETAWELEKTALVELFGALKDVEVNVGVLLYTETGGDDSNVDGGYIRSAMRFMPGPTPYAGKTVADLYAEQISEFHEGDDKGNGGKSALGFAEAYLYFSGGDPEAGNGKVKTDYDGNLDGTRTVTIDDVEVTLEADQAVYNLSGNALDSKDDSPYNSPLPEGYCGKNYIIFISNGPNQDNTADTVRAETILASLGGDISQISITPGGNASNASDEWTRFMRYSDYAVTTFVVDVNRRDTGQGPNWTALLKSVAGSPLNYFDPLDDDDPDKNLAERLRDIFDSIFSRILAKNSVFAAVALPATSNTQSTFINQVYIGQFRPDEDALPVWMGNLKQYKLGFEEGSTVLRLLDADDEPVIDSDLATGTGFILECVRSFWTPDTPDDYWSYLDPNDRRGSCTTVPGSRVSNYPDGPVVEKGGQAYVGRGGATYDTARASSRVVKTITGGLCGPSPLSTCTLDSFDDSLSTTDVTPAMVGATTDAERDNFINWARGADIHDEDGDGDPNDIRPTLHGDVVHAQPIALDYRDDPNDPGVVVFYGSNDGMLRAINGNRETAHDGTTVGMGTAAGAEFWAFMPPEFYPHIERNYENAELVRFPATAVTAPATGAQKPYGPDGPLTTWVDGSTRYLYQTMRRGGRTVYGFDISDINNPALVFRTGCTTPLGDSSGCATGWSDVGETWSPATPVLVDEATPVTYLLMGGGYDDCEDFDDPNTPANHNCSTATTAGDKIYVLNAATGELVHTLDTERAVPGKITPVTVSDFDQRLKFAYAADTGGNVYRISGSTAGDPIGSTPPTGWTITKIGDFGCDATATATCTAQRKFLFGPDVVRIPSSTQLGVFLGSGDREKPVIDYGGAAAVDNYFYGIFDNPASNSWLSSESGTCGEATMCSDSLTAVDPNGPLDPTEPFSTKGWRLQLRDDEQVVSGALVVADVVNFSTHIPKQPDASACQTDLGTATTYNVGFRTGQGELNTILGGGLVPTPVAGKVILDDGTQVPFCVGCGGENSAIGGSQVTSGINWEQGKSRVYWKIER